jgi:thymidine kinase
MAKLHFYYSTMNAGKSSALIQSSYNYLERGMNTVILKPAVDTRESGSIVRSRIGLEAECIMFGPDEDPYVIVEKIHTEQGKLACVFVDESQFMTEKQVYQLALIVDTLNIPVVCYGLRSDFRGKLFPGSAALFSFANKLIEVKTICWCGKGATMVLRLDENGNPVTSGNQVEVGGNDKYVSVCRNHFFEGQPHS